MRFELVKVDQPATARCASGGALAFADSAPAWHMSPPEDFMDLLQPRGAIWDLASLRRRWDGGGAQHYGGHGGVLGFVTRGLIVLYEPSINWTSTSKEAVCSSRQDTRHKYKYAYCVQIKKCRELHTNK